PETSDHDTNFGEGSAMATAVTSRGGVRRPEARIFLQPVAAPAVLGYFALGSALIVYGSWLGVCLSTAAPGAVHLLNGLYDAMVDQARDHRHDVPRPDRHEVPPGPEPRLPVRERRELQPAADGTGARRERRQPRLPQRALQSERQPHLHPDRLPGHGDGRGRPLQAQRAGPHSRA